MAARTRRAFVSGIAEADGSNLVEPRREKGCPVHGLVRRSKTLGTQRIEHLYRDVQVVERPIRLHHGDTADGNA